MNERQRLALDQIRPYIARAHNFSGWNFREVSIRALSPEPPWDYAALVRQNVEEATCLLDMGTGGGEFLASVGESLPSRTVATEEWVVNAPIAQERLQPFGIEVVRCKSLQLPFADEAFDLVINRHEELDPREVARVLRRGGIIITQQVGRNNWKELREYFPRKNDFGDLLGDYARGFEAAGLRVIRNQAHDWQAAFSSLGDLVYMLLVAPWEIPDFDPVAEIGTLLRLETDCSREEGLVLTESRFLLVAEKPV